MTLLSLPACMRTHGQCWRVTKPISSRIRHHTSWAGLKIRWCSCFLESFPSQLLSGPAEYSSRDSRDINNSQLTARVETVSHRALALFKLRSTCPNRRVCLAWREG